MAQGGEDQQPGRGRHHARGIVVAATGGDSAGSAWWSDTVGAATAGGAGEEGREVVARLRKEAEVLAGTPVPATKDRQAGLLGRRVSGVRPRRRGPALDSRVANSLSDCAYVSHDPMISGTTGGNELGGMSGEGSTAGNV